MLKRVVFVHVLHMVCAIWHVVLTYQHHKSPLPFCKLFRLLGDMIVTFACHVSIVMPHLPFKQQWYCKTAAKGPWSSL